MTSRSTTSGSIARDERQGLVAVARHPDFVTAAREQELEGRDDVRLVVGNQYPVSIRHATSFAALHHPARAHLQV